MSTNSERVLGDQFAPARLLPLFNTAVIRRIETIYAGKPASDTLMQRAGVATAKLVLALAPHARVIWIACGPGNNGGDGLEAALHLHRMGKQVVVSELQGAHARTGDALISYQRAVSGGVSFQAQAPAGFDFCVV